MFEKISLLIFCDSAKVLLEVGGKKLPEILLQKAAEKNFAQIFLCVDRETLPIQILSWKYEAKILTTKSLAKALAKIKTDWAFAVSADMPFFDFEILQGVNLKRQRAVLPIVGGEVKSAAGFFHKSLAQKISDADLLDEIKKVPHKFIEVAADEKIFFRVKTRADLRLAQGRAANLQRKVPIISIAVTDAETNFTEKLVQSLAAENISVGMIKSSAEINLQVAELEKFPGAKNFAIISPEGWLMFQRTEEREDFLQVAEKFVGADLILIESGTPKVQPALSLLESEDITADKKIAATFSSNLEASDEVFAFRADDLTAAVKVCKFLMS